MTHCYGASVRDVVENFSLSRLFCPAEVGLASSVLFDRVIPNVTEPERKTTWACQLLTMNATSDRAVINFDFTAIDFTGIDRVKLWLFNCPQWGIAIDAITLHQSRRVKDVQQVSFLDLNAPKITSCDSLIKVCIPCQDCDSTHRILGLIFHSTGANWIHIAEVRFYDSGVSSCPEDIIITMSTPNTCPLDTTITMSTPDTTITTSTVPSIIPIILPVVFLSLLLIVMCVVVVLLILCRCCHAKQHKHNTPRASQPRPQQHPPPLSEEMGRAHISTVEDEAGVDCCGNQCYNLQQHGVNKEITTLSQPGTRQVDGKRNSKKTVLMATNPHVSDANTAVDWLYAQVKSQVVMKTLI